MGVLLSSGPHAFSPRDQEEAPDPVNERDFSLIIIAATLAYQCKMVIIVLLFLISRLGGATTRAKCILLLLFFSQLLTHAQLSVWCYVIVVCIQNKAMHKAFRVDTFAALTCQLFFGIMCAERYRPSFHTAMFF